MRTEANNYILRVLAQRILGILVFFLFARWSYGVRSITYFAMYLVFALISLALLRGVSPSALAARGKMASNTPVWDRIILAVYWVFAYFAIYLFAGLEAASAPAKIGWVFGVGAALFLLSFLLTIWAVRVNPFLESVSRIQKDRGQCVCCVGPYAVIRHPTYAAVILWCAAAAMMFETKYTAICAAFIAVLMILRTALEDRMLQVGLSGYDEYAQKVKYRLIPFIW